MKALRYQVTVNVSKVELSVKFPCSLQVMWKRGLNKCLTRTKEKSKNIFIVNEALTLDFNVSENTSKKTYLIALLNVDGQSKLAGVVNFNINETMPIEGQCQLNLERSPDPNAKIYFTYQVVNLGDTDLSESRASESFHHKTLGESFGFDKENVQKVLSSKKVPNLEVTLVKELYDKSLKDLDQQKVKNTQLQDQITKLQSEKQQNSDEIASLRKQIIQLKNENEYLEEQFENQKKEIQKLKENGFLVNQLQVQVEKLNHEIENYKIQNQVLENKYQQSFKKAKLLEEKVEYAQFNKIERSTNTQFFEIPEFVEKNSRLKTQEELSQELSRKAEKLTFELQFTQNKLKTSEQELTQIKGQFTTQQSQFSQLKDRITGLECENAKFKQRITLYEQEAQNKDKLTQKNVNDQQKQIDFMKEQLRLNIAQNEDLKEKHKQAIEKIEKQTEIIDQQNEELTMQNMQFLKQLQILTKRQEQFGIV